MDKIRILLAEDHAVVREGTRSLLEQEEDLQVVAEAGDGEEAVRLAQELQPNVVLMDVAMPRLSGVEATRRIKEICPSASVLVLSAYDDDQYVFALLEAGAAGYLLKNVRGRELIEAVRATYSGESVLSPSVARKVLNRFAAAGRRLPKDGEQEEQPLTSREMAVLGLAAQGLSNKEIARELAVSVRTVQAHLGNIFSKLQVGSRTEAVVLALRRGWLTLGERS